MHGTAAIVPIRDFSGMTRLSSTLDLTSRAQLSRGLAEKVVVAAESVGLSVLIVTSDEAVKLWARSRDIEVCEDPGRGLSAAVAAGVSRVGGRLWIAIHADLPLITPAAIRAVVHACTDCVVLVPSYNGGTTVIASRGAFPFSYGAGSIQRHLASAPNARVIASRALSIDIDTPRDLRVLPPDLLSGFTSGTSNG